MFNQQLDLEYFNNLSEGHFPATLGIKITKTTEGLMMGEMPIQKSIFAPNGFVHAGSIVTFADTVAGYVTIAHLPEGAKSFTTLEIKSNFIGAVRTGILICECTPEHVGRTTQVWRVVVTSKETKKRVAVFSCTQLILK